MSRLPRIVRAKLDQAIGAAEFKRCGITPDRIADEILLALPRDSSRLEFTDAERDAAARAGREIHSQMTSYVDTWVAHRLRTIARWDDGEIDGRTLSYDL